MRVTPTAPATPARPVAAPKAALAARATAAPDSLQLSAPVPAASASPNVVMAPPIKRDGSTWLGVGSAMGAVGLAAYFLGGITGAWLPLLAGGAALTGVLALCGVGLTHGWGEAAGPRPFDKTRADWSPMAIMTRAVGAIGVGGCLIATALGTGAVAMTAGPAAVVAWPAVVVATALVGVLGWAMLKEPNPLGRGK